jgi:signal transduction histidine kinase/DNA-binding response OmpR family regulator/HAMP domain-containing protein
MLKSRLYWKVFANFALLLAILTAMTLLTLTIINQIQERFDVSTSDLRMLAVVEQMRSTLDDVPPLALKCAYTKSPEARSAYSQKVRDFALVLGDLQDKIKDTVTLRTMRDVHDLFFSWIENVGTRMVALSEKTLKPEDFQKEMQDIYDSDQKAQYLENARRTIQAFYRAKLRAQPYNIERAQKLSRDLTFFITLVNVLFAVFAIALGLFLTSSITKPVRLVRKGAEDIMAGKYSQIDLQRSDELGELAKVFNQMSKMLGENYTRLGAYSELVTTLNNLKGLEEVPMKSLQLLCTHTHSSIGALYLVNKKKDSLDLIATYGLANRNLKKLKFGEGLPGQCAIDKKAIEIHDIPPSSPYTIDTGIVGVVPKAIIAQPILFQDQLLGVLVLGSMHEFEDFELEILNNSIPQLAVAITNTLNDDSARKLSLEIAQRNEELNAKNSELQDAYRVKSDFLASMSHELRTPMNSIIGFSSVLLAENAEPLTADQRMAIEKVLKNGKHLLQLINDILDLSKIEAGRMTINVETEDIQTVVSNSLMTVEPMLKAKNLSHSVESTTAAATLTTDTVKVGQILTNLLSNAVKFTETGGITVRVFDKDDFLAFAVRDTGIGIEKKNLELIFKEFQQVDSSNTRKYKGTGLGLAIARRLARMLGGDLNVESIVGQGTTFTLTVPQVYTEQKESRETGGDETAKMPQQETHIPARMALQAGKGVHVLCIDDDPDVLEILKKYLVPEGYAVDIALSGEEGIQLAIKQKPALITLDIMMPQKDGWQVLRELKQHDETKDIPVIIHSIVDNKPQALSLGAVDFITKPTEAKQLLEVVRRYCSSSGKSILIVDDNEDFALSIKQMLGRDYHDIRIAENGKEALEILKTFAPSLIFLDLIMPEMNGFEVVRRLQQDKNLQSIPVVILSGADVNKEEMNILNTHIVDFIRKGDLPAIDLSTMVKRFMNA